MNPKPFHPQETREIYIRLEQYDDIFSDFDIRPYSERALSVDFIDEMRRAAQDKSDAGVDLVLYVPDADRDGTKESAIKERLTAHFDRHYKLLQREKRKVLGNGIMMVILGIVCMLAATFIVSEDPTHDLVLSFFVVFLEPAAWFLLWEGMDLVIFSSKNVNPELAFYRKMSNAHERISFRAYRPEQA